MAEPTYHDIIIDELRTAGRRIGARSDIGITLVECADSIERRIDYRYREYLRGIREATLPLKPPSTAVGALADALDAKQTDPVANVLDLYPDAEIAAQFLRRAIESLGEVSSIGAAGPRTDSGTPHVIFCNGLRHREGITAPPPVKSLWEGVMDTFFAVQSYRYHIDAPATLVWRVPPQIERVTRLGGSPGWSIYCRLAFERVET